MTTHFKRTLLSWSSGKDSAYALHLLQQNPSINVLGLFTTVNERFDRVAMHSTRVKLLKQQAKEINLPLEIIYLPYPCSNEQYEEIMECFIDSLIENSIEAVAFGDIFLEDIKEYRIRQMQGTEIETLFPCWGINSTILSQRIIDSGIKAKLVCIDPKQLDQKFAGMEYSEEFVSNLPNKIDPCGENGEFHSFVYDAPFFTNPIDIVQGETIEREGFIYTDYNFSI